MAVTHDYTTHRWGHALHDPKIEALPAQRSALERLLFKKAKTTYALKCLGHGRVSAGDFITIKMKSGNVAKFVVREIEHFYNPKDMFEIKRADFVGYVEDSAQ